MTPRRSRIAMSLIIGLGSASAGTSALAQHLGQAGGEDLSWWRVVGALAVCLALAVGGALAMRARLRAGAPLFTAATRRVQLVESLRLSHQVDVCLLKCDDRHILLAATAQGAILIDANHPAPASAERS
jgi:flagellar biogenesis protein FliO